jgi:flagellar hook-length control protein FliK
MAPVAGVPGTPVDPQASAVSPVTLPTVDAIVSSPVAAESTLPALAIPAVQPVFTAMVNAADPAEADIAALMAATALATRGVAARPPEPVPPSALPTAPEASVPDDFIGPVRPVALMGDPATMVVDNASGAPEAAEAQATIVQVAFVDTASSDPADFIGPQLPADRQIPAVEPAQPDLGTSARKIEVILSQPAPLPEAQALLQPKSEVIGKEQPEEDMVPFPMLTAETGHAPVHADGPVLAATISASAMIAHSNPPISAMDAAEAKTFVRAMAAPVRPQDDTFERAAESTRYALPTNVVDAANAAVNAQADDSQPEWRNETGIAAIVPDASNEPALALLRQQAAIAMSQAVSQDPTSGHTDATKTVRVPQVLPPVTIDPRTGLQTLTRDEALLRVMNEITPAKPQTSTKTDRTVSFKSTTVSDLAASIAPDDAAELTPRVLRETVRIEADAMGPLRHALARASADRNEARDLAAARSTEHALDTNAERTTMDSKVAAMVRSVTVTPGTTGSATDKLTDTTIVTPSPVATPTAESIARDANRVVSVSADGRRDTKRDAEIRQRQIEQQINVALRSGTPEIRMQLYPPGLGQVVIRLALDGQKLRLSMMSDNEDASASLALTEAGLRDALARDGYSLAGFDVHDKGEKNRRQQSWADTATQPTTPAAEGDAFSVDVTA